MRRIWFEFFIVLVSVSGLFGRDWLVEGVEERAVVRTDDGGKSLVLENGLVRRVIRVEPDGATVAFDNLMTGESMLRGVKPEAQVVLEGVEFEVGGLDGQPNYAYLLDEWVQRLEANPEAFSFVGYQKGETEPRFAWKRVRYCENRDWPPKGAGVRMDYRLGKDALKAASKGRVRTSVRDRELLIADDLSEDSRGWTIQTSGDERSSFMNEGKFGEIYARANTCAYAERKLPAGAEVVQVKVDPGTDMSASWGPGIAVVWGQRVIKFYLRPGEGRFGIFDGRGERLIGQMEQGRAYYLRVEIGERSVFCDASLDGEEWFEVAKVGLSKELGSPKVVRAGKTSRSGGADDFGGTPGDFARCRVSDFAVYGDLDAEAKARRERVFARLGKVTVSVHYEIYDGIPLICKWLSIRNESKEAVRLDSFASEVLAMVEYESHVENYERWNLPNIHVESDYEFGGMNAYVANQTTHWEEDPEYLTQVSYKRENPCMLVSRPEVGPGVEIEPGRTFETFRTFELVFDSTERERNGLAVRRMYRTIAPWVTENPIMMHVRRADPASVKLAIDQCAEVGFEMVILTFGSGFNIENTSEAYLKQMKKLADYAHGKGIELGGYSLLSSRRISDETDVIDVETGRPGGAKFGNAPCIGSEWGREYFRKLYAFFEETGFDLLEHDGSYPGDRCASRSHPGHEGCVDSQYRQWKVISDFYKWCRGRGIYLNVPDFYYLSGSNKCGMGYRETNWSLPRDQQIIHGRQNIYDGTWTKTPSMGWMFVPLVQYHGGGAAATLEPLAEHLDAYEAHLAQNFGSGVQACYRGPRLYDSERTKAVVKKWVDFYKKYRVILDSDVVHVRRADGRDIDCLLHVNPKLEVKGLAMVYNPLTEAVERELVLPLYYTGLKDKARIRERGGKQEVYELNRGYEVAVPIRMEAESVTWLTVE